MPEDLWGKSDRRKKFGRVTSGYDLRLRRQSKPTRANPPSVRQARLLAQYGLVAKTYWEASGLLCLIQANGWRLPASLIDRATKSSVEGAHAGS